MTILIESLPIIGTGELKFTTIPLGRCYNRHVALVQFTRELAPPELDCYLTHLREKKTVWGQDNKIELSAVDPFTGFATYKVVDTVDSSD